jgi:hypothetical protein
VFSGTSTFHSSLTFRHQSILDYALVTYLIGLGIYLRFVWQSKLDIGSGNADDRNIFIVFLVCIVFCVGVYCTYFIVDLLSTPYELGQWTHWRNHILARGPISSTVVVQVRGSHCRMSRLLLGVQTKLLIHGPVVARLIGICPLIRWMELKNSTHMLHTPLHALKKIFRSR